uniref:Uncharacterized protein n=1 Tax=Triticum urartu TaxID=4572 RepID=A0A8R7TKY6_TRIUA
MVITRLQMPNLWKDLTFRVVMRNTFRKTDAAAGHGIRGTVHSDGGPAAPCCAVQWKIATTATDIVPNNAIPHRHFPSILLAREKPIELSVRSSRKRRTWSGRVAPTLAYRW